MFRNSDLYFMANYAQTVNVIGAIKTTGTKAWLETTGQALKLYRHHFGTIPVAVEETTDGLDVAAAWKEDRSALTLALVNTTDRKKTIQWEADGLALPKTISGWLIQHDDPDAYNDENNRDKVKIQEVSLVVTDDRLNVNPYSVTMLTIPAGN